MTFRTHLVAMATAVMIAGSAATAQAGSIVRLMPDAAAGLSSASQDLQPVHNWRRNFNHTPVRRLNLTANQVRRILRHKGFNRIRFTDRSGRIYRLYARTRHGQRVRLVVSARNARIIRWEPIYRIY